MDQAELEHYFNKKNDELEKRINIVELVMYILVFTVFSLAVFFNLFVTSTVPKFRKIFEELLQGEPIPWLTYIVTNYAPYGLGIDFLFGLILIILCVSGKLKYFLPLGIIFTVILFVKMTFLYISLFLPLISIINKLGGG